MHFLAKEPKPSSIAENPPLSWEPGLKLLRTFWQEYMTSVAHVPVLLIHSNKDDVSAPMLINGSWAITAILHISYTTSPITY